LHSHLECQQGILHDTAWSGIYTLYLISAALALLVYLWNCCSHVTVDVSLCWASECTLLPVDEEAEDCTAADPEPEGTHCGKARSQSPPAELV